MKAKQLGMTILVMGIENMRMIWVSVLTFIFFCFHSFIHTYLYLFIFNFLFFYRNLKNYYEVGYVHDDHIYISGEDDASGSVKDPIQMQAQRTDWEESEKKDKDGDVERDDRYHAMRDKIRRNEYRFKKKFLNLTPDEFLNREVSTVLETLVAKVEGTWVRPPLVLCAGYVYQSLLKRSGKWGVMAPPLHRIFWSKIRTMSPIKNF